MKLKQKLIMAFIAVMTFPIIMMSVATYSIVNLRFRAVDESDIQNGEELEDITNPLLMANRVTKNTFNELKQVAEKHPDRLADATYLLTLDEMLQKKNSCLIVKKGKEIIFSGDAEIFDILKSKLPAYNEYSLEDEDGLYIGGERPLLVKGKVFQYPDESIGTLYVVSDISGYNVEAKGSIAQIFLSVIIIMFVTAAALAIWLYGSMFKPLKELQASTNNMKEGNLDVSVTPQGSDEIGELCEDFEEMRLHMKDLLEDSMRHEQDYKDLMRNISHDLKTPLTAIKGYAEGILDGVADTPEKREKYLRTICAKANDMTALVDELSMYAKIDTNAVPYNFMNLNLNDYFDETIVDIRVDLELQDVDIGYYPGVEKDQEVIADPEQLNRVIHNIISNAVKYREPTRRTVISVRTTDIDDSNIRIQIEDNGKGISVKDLPYVFDRFYRTDASRNSTTGGSGLGLAIVKKIIEDHGGRIWAESKLGVGTTINILLKKVPEIINEVPEEEEEIKGKPKDKNKQVKKPAKEKPVKEKPAKEKQKKEASEMDDILERLSEQRRNEDEQ